MLHSPLLAVLALGLSTAAVQAQPDNDALLPVAVVLIHTASMPLDSEALLASVEEGGWYQRTTPVVDLGAVMDCATLPEAGREPCVRAALETVHPDYPPTVVVLSRTAADGALTWRCIGLGRHDANRDRQTARFQPDQWDDASERAWEDDRAAAVGCILAAANEVGWD